jgi:hypothetical protein
MYRLLQGRSAQREADTRVEFDVPIDAPTAAAVANLTLAWRAVPEAALRSLQESLHERARPYPTSALSSAAKPARAKLKRGVLCASVMLLALGGIASLLSYSGPVYQGSLFLLCYLALGAAIAVLVVQWRTPIAMGAAFAGYRLFPTDILHLTRRKLAIFPHIHLRSGAIYRAQWYWQLELRYIDGRLITLPHLTLHDAKAELAIIAREREAATEKIVGQGRIGDPLYDVFVGVRKNATVPVELARTPSWPIKFLMLRLAAVVVGAATAAALWNERNMRADEAMFDALMPEYPCGPVGLDCSADELQQRVQARALGRAQRYLAKTRTCSRCDRIAGELRHLEDPHHVEGTNWLHAAKTKESIRKQHILTMRLSELNGAETRLESKLVLQGKRAHAEALGSGDQATAAIERTIERGRSTGDHNFYVYFNFFRNDDATPFSFETDCTLDARSCFFTHTILEMQSRLVEIVANDFAQYYSRSVLRVAQGHSARGADVIVNFRILDNPQGAKRIKMWANMNMFSEEHGTIDGPDSIHADSESADSGTRAFGKLAFPDAAFPQTAPAELEWVRPAFGGLYAAMHRYYFAGPAALP